MLQLKVTPWLAALCHQACNQSHQPDACQAWPWQFLSGALSGFWGFDWLLQSLLHTLRECNLPPDLSAACLPVAAALVCCRCFLQSPQAPQGAAQAAEANNEHLDSALQKSGKIIQIRECYVQAPAKDSQDAVDQLRGLLIEVLQQKESFRKSEVQKLLKDRNVAIDDRTYARIVKEWCISKGNVWKLKPGASST